MGGFGGAAGVTFAGEGGELIEREKAEIVSREVDDEDVNGLAVEIDNGVSAEVARREREWLRRLDRIAAEEAYAAIWLGWKGGV